jgi:hypothetical protein
LSANLQRASVYPLTASTMPGPTPHRTPLRRVSHGSLFALSRSGAHTDAPHGLGFLEPALAELADEAEALRANVDGLRALSASLDTFNEAFASWLYVMNMNALTVDWPEVSVEPSPFFVSTILVKYTGTGRSVVHPCEAEGRCVFFWICSSSIRD